MLNWPFLDLGNPLTAVVSWCSWLTVLEMVSTRSTTPDTRERDTMRLRVPMVACIMDSHGVPGTAKKFNLLNEILEKEPFFPTFVFMVKFTL